jgi:hypothetical protein
MNYGGLSYVSSLSANYNNTTKTWTVGDLAPGATQSIQITFRVPVAGTFAPTSKASTTSPELSTGNNRGATTLYAGISAPTSPVVASMWFLSSGTNSKRTTWSF